MQPTTVAAFLRAVVSSWLTGMSGPLSVPLAIAAVFVPSNIAKVGLGATALACFWGASYGVWARERRYRNELEAKLSHSHALLFGFEVCHDSSNMSNELEIRLQITNKANMPLAWYGKSLTVKVAKREFTSKDKGPYVIHQDERAIWFMDQGLSHSAYDALGRETGVLVNFEVEYGLPDLPRDRIAEGTATLTFFKNPQFSPGYYRTIKLADTPLPAILFFLLASPFFAMLPYSIGIGV